MTHWLRATVKKFQVSAISSFFFITISILVTCKSENIVIFHLVANSAYYRNYRLPFFYKENLPFDNAMYV